MVKNNILDPMGWFPKIAAYIKSQLKIDGLRFFAFGGRSVGIIRQKGDFDILIFSPRKTNFNIRNAVHKNTKAHFLNFIDENNKPVKVDAFFKVSNNEKDITEQELRCEIFPED